MKNSIVVTLAFALVLLGSMNVFAASFVADGSYLINHEVKEERGFLVNAEAELYPNLLVEGSFLNMKTADDADVKSSQNMMLGGAKYRLLTQDTLQVFAGAGYLSYEGKTESEAEGEGEGGEVAVAEAEENIVKGSGVCGRVAAEVQLGAQLNLTGDVSWAPWFGEEDDRINSLLSGKASLSYQVLDNVSVQGTIMYNSVKVRDSGTELTASTQYGGGVVIRF